MTVPPLQYLLAFNCPPPHRLPNCSKTFSYHGAVQKSSSRCYSSPGLHKRVITQWGRFSSEESRTCTPTFLMRHDRKTHQKTGIAMSTTDRSTKVIDVVSVGNMCIDIMLPISKYPIAQGEHQRLRHGAFFEIGGSLNALISATRLKARTAAIAYISTERKDLHPSEVFLSEYLRSAAQREGINVQGLVPHFMGTVATCAALFDPSGSHTFLASNEDIQNIECFNQQLPKVMEDRVIESRAIIIDGYALHSDRELVRQCLQVAVRNECEIWFDPQAATKSLVQRNDHLFSQILESAEGISLNLDEAKMLTGKDDVRDIIQALPCLSNAKTVLLKDGPRGCQAFAKTKIGEEMCSAPGFDLANNYRDSIGAGDAFIGAFLAGKLVHGLELRDCCLLANAMAAATCVQHGAGSSGIGSQDQMMQMLSRGSLNLSRILETLELSRLSSTDR